MAMQFVVTLEKEDIARLLAGCTFAGILDERLEDMLHQAITVFHDVEHAKYLEDYGAGGDTRNIMQRAQNGATIVEGMFTAARNQEVAGMPISTVCSFDNTKLAPRRVLIALISEEALSMYVRSF